MNPEMVKGGLSASDTDAKGYLVRPDKTREAHDKALVSDDLGLQQVRPGPVESSRSSEQNKRL